MHPAEAIEQILKSFEGELSILLRVKARLADAFGQLAKVSIEKSDEIVPVATLTHALRSSHPWTEPMSEKAVEKLIELGLFQSIDAQRAAFYHQSVTEMLAAKVIGQEADLRPEVIDQVLSAPSWDGVLNLLPYYLSDAAADSLLQRLQSGHDYSLATKFLRGFGENQSSIVSRLLDRLLKHRPEVPDDKHHNFYMSLRHLPVGPEHTGQLKLLTKCGDFRSKGAMRALFQLVERHHQHPFGDYP